MARGRMISTSIALDPEFNAMSPEAQLLFLRAVPHLDRDGLILGQSAALWATIAPLQTELLPRIGAIVSEWSDSGLVIVFDTKIGPVLYFDGFHKNQVGMRYDREPESRLPIPPEYERTADGIRQVSGDVPEDARQVSGKYPLEVEVERKGAGVKSDSGNLPAAAAAAIDSSDEARVVEAWEENEMRGKPTGSLLKTLRELIAEFGAESVLAAIGIAVERDNKRLDYIRGILRKGVNAPTNGASPPGPSIYEGVVLVRDEDGDE